MITKEQLKEEVQQISKSAQKVFDECGHCDLMFFVLYTDKDDKKHIDIFGAPSSQQDLFVENRFRILYELGKQISQRPDIKTIDGIICVSEIWISSLTKKEAKKLEKEGKPMPLPSESPNRKEGVQVSGINNKNEGYSELFEIKEINHKRSLKKLEDSSKFTQMEHPLLSNFWKGVLNL
jgi:hypothetical protein